MAHLNGTSGPRFRVSMLEVAKEQLRDIAVAVAKSGSDSDVAAAFRNTLRSLELDPRELGEPLFHYRKLKMTVRCAALIPLYIVYAVHDEQPVVVIRRVAALAINFT
jgi:ParE toxin of type II toxin-antitoxin system, parDE